MVPLLELYPPTTNTPATPPMVTGAAPKRSSGTGMLASATQVLLLGL